MKIIEINIYMTEINKLNDILINCTKSNLFNNNINCKKNNIENLLNIKIDVNDNNFNEQLIRYKTSSLFSFCFIVGILFTYNVNKNLTTSDISGDFSKELNDQSLGYFNPNIDNRIGANTFNNSTRFQLRNL